MSTAQQNARYLCDRFPSASLDDASFDAVFSMEALYYLPDLDAALAAIRRLLAPGGRFACVVDFFEEHEASRSWPDDLGVAMKRLSAAGWREAIARAGLELAHQERLENSLITCATLPA
jgi:ubiquinone/menaquinone biosynthesis C-methylase UbiE